MAPLKDDPDRLLVEACQAVAPDGLEGAFRELYDTYKDRVYNVCFRITGNGADALDSSQETFGILFRKIVEFRFESKFSSWVYRIAVNAAIDQKRRAGTRRTAAYDLEDEQGRPRELRDGREETPTEYATRNELEDEVQRAIDRLSPKMRAITVLRYVEDLSYEEISDTLGISLGTVKSRLSRAHDALESELTPVLDKHRLGEDA